MLNKQFIRGDQVERSDRNEEESEIHVSNADGAR